MKQLTVVLASVLLCSAPMPVAADASACAYEASKLRREARDLEDAADSWSSASDSEARDARSDVQNSVSTVRDRLSRVVRECGSSPASAVAVLASIRGYLLVRFGDEPATRSVIELIQPSLQGIARLHASVSPADYRMTYAVAEALYVERRNDRGAPAGR